MSHLLGLRLTGWCERLVPCVELLEMPVLQELLIEAETIEALSPLFDKVADTLSTLTLNAIPEDIRYPTAHIGKLRKLRHLVLLNCASLGRDFSTALASREAAGLPRLECITMRDPKLNEGHAAQVSSLMQRLHAHAVSGAAGAVSFELSVENTDGVPEWFLRQYEFTTGDIDDHDGEEGGSA
ncbi:hypothetical protein AURDEDRAFT_114860 [Auricularia subglabra TFB-10046 SS5]|nr:hypothetical protein AURDEDRAFT_114860 [Auricularia subglabra TFB-10046 SS5]